MPNDSTGSFARWQAITIGQLSYAINLILGFSVAALGFQLSLLQNSDFCLSSWGKCAYLISLTSLSVSTAFGVWVVINRLRDFRLTTKTARKREEMLREKKKAEVMLDEKKAKDEIDCVLSPYRMKSKALGETTWVLFWWQIGSFAGGIFFATLAVLAVFGEKLL